MGSFKVLYDYPNFASLPAVGEVSKLYITNDNNTLYRWVDGAYHFFTTTSVPWGNIAGTITNQADLMALINARELAITSGTTAQYWRGDKTFQTLNTAVVPESGNLYYTQGRFDSALAAKSTTNLAEGTNLYYTQARFNSAFGAKSTTDLAEGSNLYYTDGRFDTRLAGKSTSDLAEGSNLYYTQGRFDSAFTAKDSDDLNEGATNFYYTSNRFNSDFNTKNTDVLAEGISNVYFTAGRARNAVSLTTVGTGSASYNSSTGVINIPVYQDALVDPLTGAGADGYLGKYTGSTSIAPSLVYDNGVYVGVNRTNPFYTLDVNGTFNVEGNAIFRDIAGAGDRVVFADASGQLQSATIGTGLSYASGTLSATGVGTGSVGGTGTAGYVAKFSGTNSIGNSNIQDSGTLITLGSNTTISTGGLGIGTTASANHSLRIGKSISGGTTAYGILNAGTVQSDVTGSLLNNYSQLNTAAASFTLGSYTHYGTTQGVIGAGSAVTNQYAFQVASTLIGATNNYGFHASIPAGLNRWNLFMLGSAQNYLGGATVIGGGSATVGGVGAILTVTLTSGGSGYVDGTYTNVPGTNINAGGATPSFTAVVSGGIVTTITVAWGGVNYAVGDTLTILNTQLGGTGSGLVITVATAEADILRVQGSTNNARLTLMNFGSGIASGEEISAIRFAHRDSSSGASGTQAYIQALSTSTNGGADLLFGLKPPTTFSLATEDMRLRGATGALLIGASTQVATATKLEVTGGALLNGNVGIGGTYSTSSSLYLSDNITGSTAAYAIQSIGTIQSDVTSAAYYNRTLASTQAATFTLGTVGHYMASQGTFGAGSTVTNQYGFIVLSTLTGATNNYAFRSQIPSGTNRWNLFMDGTAQNYLAGALSIGVTTANASALLQVDSTTQGVLFPRMTTTQKNAIASPAVGLIIYDTTLNKLCVYTGAWQTITSS